MNNLLELFFQEGTSCAGSAALQKCLESFISELIFEGLLKELTDTADNHLKCLILECIKILSRDKLFIEHILKAGHVQTVLQCAQLASARVPNVQEFEVQLFDMKLLHLITGLNSAISDDDPNRDSLPLISLTIPCLRPKLRYDLHGLTYLIEVLDLMLQPGEEPIRSLDSSHVNLCIEVLKVLFNITIVEGSLNEEEEAHFMRLVSVLHDLLLCPVQSADKKHELHCHTVHLLTVVPSDSYEELLTPAEIKVTHLLTCEDSEYEGKNMDAIIVLLEFLKIQLDKASPSGASNELLCPILHSLCRMCRANRIIRKYCRMQILPYLGDEVRKLPEEGHLLRNKLCKLFTHNSFEIKSLSADFIFVLCKENSGRFIKYTGYGNAAGLLAERGLMAGINNSSSQPLYSSESEDSETEEYAKLKENVNPVTGRWEEPKANVMDDMSDEQKEYVANELLNKIDQLQRSGVIKPMKVSESGRPVVVDSVAELVETCNIRRSSSEDSD
ncbi:hypothetical protein HELRODRAFT_174453 [Helobdella robusta]|uniref:Synembryn-A n=1 Tax=Helobdella robusta TaxID=6412 RepID=T1F851_HELRO|nr:hypothetical protein HELRODRAFT_174453 [Helobdella robusta]ESO01502.1 hypothetical protein HELRODRAFT_174453 [Helobdella robusta]